MSTEKRDPALERLKAEWSVTIQPGVIIENSRTGQWMIIEELPVVETLAGPGAALQIVCKRCGASFKTWRAARPREETAFNISRVPEYSGGWLIAPVVMEDRRVVAKTFRCSCAVGRSRRCDVDLYDGQPDAIPNATQEILTIRGWALEKETRA